MSWIPMSSFPTGSFCAGNSSFRFRTTFMSVYTPVDSSELEVFLNEYDLGALIHHRGISEGIENTNYFVTTTHGEFVLTLFEFIGFDDLSYYLELMAFMAEHGLPCAHPLADRSGRYLRSFKGKPASLVQRLRGHSVMNPSLDQCRIIGKALGRLHVEGRDFPGRRENTRGFTWWRAIAGQLLPCLSDADATLLQEELDFQARHRPLDLPRGVIHGDLFRDNALFSDNQLTGIIDFYYACDDALLYDVAITINDWCTYPHDCLHWDKALAVLSSYHEQRPLQPRERKAWPTLLRAAALRFWLSRLREKLSPRPGELTQIKDPGQYERILRTHVENYTDLYDLWV